MKRFIPLLFCLLCLNGFLYSQTQELWGYTFRGGESNVGLIYKVDTAGNNFQVVKDFSKNWGGGLQLPVEGKNEKLYGTAFGGKFGAGVFYEYDPQNNQRKVLYHLQPTGNSYDAISQEAIEISDGVWIGFFIGSTKAFKIDLNTNTYTTLNANGIKMHSLMKASNNKAYGVGRNNAGRDIIFEYNPTGNRFAIKYTFPTGRANGYDARFKLVENGSGKLYGTTRTSSASGGVIFEYNFKTNTFTKKVTASSWITSELVKHSNGKFYFYTLFGGPNNNGGLFEYDPANSYTTRMFYKGNAQYYRPPFELADETLIIPLEKDFHEGYILQYNIDSNQLDTLQYINGHGEFFVRGFMQHSSSKVYAYSSDRLMEYIDSTGAFNTKVRFGNHPYGYYGQGTLLQASDGMVYGAVGTYSNSSNLFRIDPSTLEHKVLHYFENADTIYNTPPHPDGEMVEYQNRYLFGMAKYSRASSQPQDIIYKYDLQTGIMEYVDSFPYTAQHDPAGKISLTDDGKIVGICEQGLSRNIGGVFVYDIPKDSLYFPPSRTTASQYCSSGLVKAAKHSYYGLGRVGRHNAGSVIEYNDSTNEVTLVTDLRPGGNWSTLPKDPRGNLLKAPNGKYYGLTKSGGSFGGGTLYEMDTAQSPPIKTLFHFGAGDSLGYWPISNLTLAGSGRLFGTCSDGGINRNGTLFEYDYLTDSMRLVFAFDSINGKNPSLGGLALINSCRAAESPTIEASLDTICGSVAVQLSVKNREAQLNSSYWVLYQDSLSTNSFASDTTGNFTVRPLATTDYFIRGEGNCVNLGEASRINIVVDSTHTVSSRDTISICEGNNFIRPTGDTLFSIYNTMVDTSILTSARSSCDSIIYTTINVYTASSVIDNRVRKRGSSLKAVQDSASYLWVSCANDSILRNDTLQNFTPANSAFYGVIIQKDNCVDTSYCVQINNSSGGGGVTGPQHKPFGGVSPLISQKVVLEETEGSFHPSFVPINMNSMEFEATAQPNPTNSSSVIRLSKKCPQLKVELLNISGQLIQAFELQEKQQFTISIEGAAGIYLLRLTNELGERDNLKLIKQ